MDKIKEKVMKPSVKKSSKSSLSDKQKAKRIKDKKIEKTKKEKYSASSSQTVIKEWKTSATRSFNSVRNTFDNLSNRMKMTSLTNQEKVSDCNDGQNYRQLGADKTPIRLYSPFSFETPSPGVDRTHLRRSCRRQMFFSPTQKMREDVMYLNNGIKELNLISEDIENRISPNSSTNLISIQSLDSNQSLI